jgi:hypothetical protein
LVRIELDDDVPLEEAIGGDVGAISEVRGALVTAFALHGRTSLAPGVEWNNGLKFMQTFDGYPVPNGVLVNRRSGRRFIQSNMRELSPVDAPTDRLLSLREALARGSLADKPADPLILQYVHPLTDSQLQWAGGFRPDDSWGVFFPAWVGQGESGLNLCIDAYSGDSVCFGI